MGKDHSAMRSSPRFQKAGSAKRGGVTGAKRRINDQAQEQASFTPAEARVLPLLATYLTLEGIADRLGVRRPTVKTHVNNIYKKLGVSTRAEAVEQAEAGGFFKNASVVRGMH